MEKEGNVEKRLQVQNDHKEMENDQNNRTIWKRCTIITERQKAIMNATQDALQVEKDMVKYACEKVPHIFYHA